jgi:exosortase
MEPVTADPLPDPTAPRPGAGARLRPQALEIALALALAVAFAPALASMAEVWDRVEHYSHGYLVPVVALWSAFRCRPRLVDLPRARDARGLIALLASLAAYGLGLAAGQVSLQGLALVGAVAGALLFLRGSAWLRALVFPVVFLAFMIPLPEAWLQPAIVQLQLFVSAAAVALLQGAGVAVARNGNVIELPGGESLFVAEACSGITSVVTLMPLGVFLAWATERSFPRRAAIVASVVPLAMLGNLLRVAITVVAAGAVGVERATGSWLHESAGLLTYVLGCVALLGVGALLRWIAPPAGPAPAP